MADRKVSELPAADALVGTEVVPGAQAGVTKKITVSAIAALALQPGDDAADLGSGSATDNYVLTADGAGGAAWEAAAAAGGDVTGPASSTDNALARFHETGGKTLQNSVATLSDTGALTLTGATVTASEPILNVTQTWNNAAVTFTGLQANITNTASAAGSYLLKISTSGVERFSITESGGTAQIFFCTATTKSRIYNSSTMGLILRTHNSRYFQVSDGSPTKLQFGPGSATLATLACPGSHVLESVDGVNAQTYRLYNTYTDASNYERLAFTWDSNTAKIQTEAAGTGTLRTLQLGPMYTATLKSGVSVTAVTTTASPAATDTGTAFTNEGDTDGATVTLPTAAAGLRFTAIVQAAQTLTITAASGDTIRIASNVTAAAGSITSAVVGSCVSLLAINATEWVATSSVGSWSF